VGRRLFSIASALSLACSLLALAELPVSFFHVASVVRASRQSNHIMRIVNGYLIVTDQRGPGMIAEGKTGPPSWILGWDAALPVPVWWSAVLLPHSIDFGNMTTATGTLSRHAVTVPLWLLATVFGMPIFLPRLSSWLSRRLPGHCDRCGYNLTGNVSGVCPECGTPVPKNSGNSD